MGYGFKSFIIYLFNTTDDSVATLRTRIYYKLIATQGFTRMKNRAKRFLE